jgi:hypothetical protein
MKFHRVSSIMALSVTAWLSACSSVSEPTSAPPPTASKAAVTAAKAPALAQASAAAEKPATKAPSAGEVALADGVKAYQASQYRQAETQLKAALKAGLQKPSDLSSAHKHLAFIYCTSKRSALCAAAFKNAKAADPDFALTKAEAGHPMWAKTYKRALGIK